MIFFYSFRLLVNNNKTALNAQAHKQQKIIYMWHKCFVSALPVRFGQQSQYNSCNIFKTNCIYLNRCLFWFNSPTQSYSNFDFYIDGPNADLQNSEQNAKNKLMSSSVNHISQKLLFLSLILRFSINIDIENTVDVRGWCMNCWKQIREGV